MPLKPNLSLTGFVDILDIVDILDTLDILEIRLSESLDSDDQCSLTSERQEILRPGAGGRTIRVG